jgi:phosphoribosyl 1,2-cyclic phosphodiesterase
MKLKFYGTRGSVPICDAGFQQFGGNTTCLQITFTDTNRIVIIDAGTGLRNLGRDLRAIGHKQEQIVIAFTHFHWDHIQGFPFFAPAYDPRQKITLLTLGRDQTVSNLREIFEVQMQAEYFPVQLDHMGANFEFLQIADASKHFTGINNVETVVTAQRHNHPGGAYSFRIERKGKVLVVCTDVEHGEQIDPRLVELARGADLLVHDAQYTAEELQKRRGWGHSTPDAVAQAPSPGLESTASAVLSTVKVSASARRVVIAKQSIDRIDHVESLLSISVLLWLFDQISHTCIFVGNADQVSRLKLPIFAKLRV